MRGGNLTIERIQEQDRGLYQCAASNEAATVVADAELMVLNVPPRAPYNLSANSTKNAVTLTWVPGYVRPKMEYSIWLSFNLLSIEKKTSCKFFIHMFFFFR